WHHLAVVKQSSATELFIDGVLAAKRDGLLSPPADVATFRIGRQRRRADFDFTQRWIGSIDEVRVRNAARTAGQIRETYLRNLTGTEPGLVGLWNFDDPANPGKDLSPGGHHGQLVGNPRVVAESRRGVGEFDVPVVDEPLLRLASVEQRVTHLLRLDGDNGA